MAENRDKFAAVDGEVYIAKCRRGLGFALLLRLIGLSYIFKFTKLLAHFYLHHTALAHQGRTSPEAVTGRPISSEVTLPPNSGDTVLPSIYCMTDAESPVV